MRNLILLCLVTRILFPVIGAAQVVFTETIHTMPVSIEIPLPDGIRSSHGTGIYLSESNKIFLVTATHVIFDLFATNKVDTLINTNAILTCDADEKDKKNILRLNLERLSAEGLIKHNPSHDVTIIQIGTYVLTNTAIEWGDAITRPLGTNSTFVVSDASYACRLFEEVPMGNDTYVLGYPISLFNGQPSEIDFDRPLVRKGVISQKNQKTRKLIIDSAVYGGNSGGPVLVVEHPSLEVTVFKIVGIITQYVPAEAKIDLSGGVTNKTSVKFNSGYGVAEPIDYALELMRK